MSYKVAFIGLGVMGYPMAGHLARVGNQVTVYNRTASRAENWCNEYAGDRATTPADAAVNAEFVFSCVGNDDDVRAIACGEDGAIAAMKPGSIFVDHTTASASLAEELSALAEKSNVDFMDAPVSGGEAGAVNGQLTVMMGGSQRIYDRVKPVIEAYSKATQLIGPAGHGQKAKMVNQICIAGLVQGLSEGLNFAQASNLDANKVIEAISKGAAQSWQMENRFEAMLAGKFEFGFAVDWMRKDLDIAMQEASRCGAELPVTELVDRFYADVQNMGGGRWDTCSLIARLKKPADF